MASGEKLLRRKSGNQGMVEVNLGNRWVDVSPSYGIAISDGSGGLNVPADYNGGDPESTFDGAFADLSGYTQARLSAIIATPGTIAQTLRLAGSVAYDTFDPYIAIGGETIDLTQVAGVYRTGWMDIPTSLQTIAWVSAQAGGGDGEEVVILTTVFAHFRR